jgi:hypothetical protein
VEKKKNCFADDDDDDFLGSVNFSVFRIGKCFVLCDSIYCSHNGSALSSAGTLLQYIFC